MSVSILQIINTLSDKGIDINSFYGNKNVWEVGKATKKNPAYIKLAIDDKMAEEFLCHPMKAISVFMALPKDEVDAYLIKLQLDGNKKEDTP